MNRFHHYSVICSLLFAVAAFASESKEAPCKKVLQRVFVRWVVRADLPKVLEIENKSFKSPWNEEDFLSTIRNLNAIGMVAEEPGGNILGHMVYRLHRNHFEILNFAVHPDHKRQEVGSAMIRKLVYKLSPTHKNQIVVTLRESNLDAQKFFQAKGFVARGVLKKYYEDTGEDGYRMTYSLPESEPKRVSETPKVAEKEKKIERVILVEPPTLSWLSKNDLPEVLKTEARAWEKPWSEEEFLAVLQGKDGAGVIARGPGGKIIGHMVYRKLPDSVELLNLAVDPAFSRQLVGTLLVNQLVTGMGPHGRKAITVEVRETNRAGQEFFKKAGFQAFETRRRSFEDTGEDGFVMRYRLGGKSEVKDGVVQDAGPLPLNPSEKDIEEIVNRLLDPS